MARENVVESYDNENILPKHFSLIHASRCSSASRFGSTRRFQNGITLAPSLNTYCIITNERSLSNFDFRLVVVGGPSGSGIKRAFSVVASQQITCANEVLAATVTLGIHPKGIPGESHVNCYIIIL